MIEDHPELSRHQIPWLWPTVTLVALGCLSFAIDVPVAEWFLRDGGPGKIAGVLRHYEAFAHGISVYTILLLVAVLDPRRRWTQPFLWAMIFGAGIASWLFKLSIYRLRPRHFDLTLPVWESFRGFFAPLELGHIAQSFPSSHTANAVALALGLSWLYPRGRWAFALLAILGGSQRVAAGAHFMSDAFFGAAIAWMVGAAILRLPDRYVARLLPH